MEILQEPSLNALESVMGSGNAGHLNNLVDNLSYSHVKKKFQKILIKI